MFFNSIKEMNRSRKEINRLLSRGMFSVQKQVYYGKGKNEYKQVIK